MALDVSSPIKPIKNKPILWTISGADCSGGAGIAADIKTGHNLNVEVCHLITANTVQNSTTFIAIHPVAIAILAEQAQALRFDKPPTVIKIGLIADKAQLTWLLTLLPILKQQLPALLVVYDPVGQASVGGRLTTLNPNEIKALLSLVDVITPNLNEAKQLCFDARSKLKNSHTMAEAIRQLGCKAVIIKGGHTDDVESPLVDCTDLCLQSISADLTQTFVLKSAKIASDYSHGGGCSFASALASFLAHGYLLRDAFTLTKAFINQGLSLTAKAIKQNNVAQNNVAQNSHQDHARNEHYYGAFEQGQWPSKVEDFPLVSSTMLQQYSALAAFSSLELADNEKLELYPVIDSLEWLARLLPLNLKIIQLRIKNINAQKLAVMIEKAVVMARHYNCRLFINDHWQLAIKYGAYGVHIGQEDLAQADLSAIAQAGLRLGISTHGCYEFLLAKQLQPSYLAIGAIFATKTKDMTGQIQGLSNLKQLLALAENTPVVAIGGINQQRLAQVWDTGVSGVAVVTAITEAAQPIIATKNLQAQLA